MKNKKLTISLIFNLIVLCLEIISFTVMGKFKLEHLKYYTVLSNILCMITSAIFVAVFFIKREKIISKWITYLKFVTTVNLVITFSVCLLILGPTKEISYKWLFFNHPNIFHHLLCPILATISFLFFEEGNLTKKITILSLVPTLVYAVVIMLLVGLKLVLPPYFFVDVISNKWYQSVIWFLVLMIVFVLFSYSIYFAKNKLQNKK